MAYFVINPNFKDNCVIRGLDFDISLCSQS